MISAFSNFIKNSGFNFVANLSDKASKSLLLILISHTLGVSSMGQISLALTYLGFGILFSNWGFGNLLIRETTKDPKLTGKYFYNFIFTRLLLVGIAILLISGIAHFFNYSAETILIIRLISLSLLSTTVVNLIYSVMVAHEVLMPLSIVYVITSILRLVFSALVIIFHGTIIQVTIVYVATEFLTLLLSVILFRKNFSHYKIELNLKFAWEQLIRAFPFLWIGMLMMLDNRTDTLIVSYFYNEDYVGYYSATNTIFGAILLFPEAIRNTIYPIISKYHENPDHQLKKFINTFSKYMLILIIPLAIATFCFSEELISFIFSGDYSISITMLRIITWSSIPIAFTIFLSGLLIYDSQEKMVAIGLFISGLLTAVLDILLIPRFGVVVVAIVRVLTSIILLLILLHYFKKYLGFSLFKSKALWLTAFCGIAMFGSNMLITPVNKILAFAVSLLIYFLTLMVSKVLKSEDKTMVKNLIREITGK